METVCDRLIDLENELLPSIKEMKAGLGNLKTITDKRIKLAFSTKITARHNKMTIEDEEDWIPSMKNKPQSFDSWLKSKPNRVTSERKTLYILALDKSISDLFLENCRLYCSAFFYGLPVKVLDNIDIKKIEVKSRGSKGTIQYNAREILKKAKKRIPSDAYGLICVLNKDIYSREEWNYVFGYADLKSRVGVFSFARYDPSFFNAEHGMTEEEVTDIVQFRGIKVM